MADDEYTVPGLNSTDIIVNLLDNIATQGDHQINNAVQDIGTLEFPVETESGGQTIATLQPVNGMQPTGASDIQSIMNGFGDNKLMIQPHLQAATNQPYVEIVEQPKPNNLRFRYECEGKGAGALQGKSSTTERKTFPKIKVHGYQGNATVIVSCVTHNDNIPRSHPHKLVSPASVTNGCKNGVCTQHIDRETMTHEFQHLGIQCVKKKDIEASLKHRKEKKVDPFRQGFDHMNKGQNIDLNAVKLCFQVWIEKNGTSVPLRPVCSDTIYDTKAKKELQIIDISENSGSVEGNTKIILLCEKVSRDDIMIKFFDNNGWEEKANFSTSDVHKQYAIVFRTPKYKDQNISEPVQVQMDLRKSKDQERSEPQDFTYLPKDWYMKSIKGERKLMKEEIKEEMYLNSPPQMDMNQIRPVAMKSSPYSQIEMSPESRTPILVQKRMPMVSTPSNSISLTNLQPTLGTGGQEEQVLAQNNVLNNPQGEQMGQFIPNVPVPNLPMLDQMQGNSQFIPYSPQNNFVYHNPVEQVDGFTQNNTDFNNRFCMTSLTSDYNNLEISSPSPPMNHGAAPNVVGGLPPVAPRGGDYAGLGGGDYLPLPPAACLPPASTSTTGASTSTQKTTKRGKSEAGLDSGKLYVATQASKNNSGHINPHNVLSRQQSSLNTPINSEQLTSDITNNDNNNFAGGAVNQL